jgi:ABC-type Mn2+/Zn2+ transport system ATPase subunit
MPPFVLQRFAATLGNSLAFDVALEPDATILVGKNGAGKSMIAEALVALRDAVAGATNDSHASDSFTLTFAEGRYEAVEAAGWNERFTAETGSWSVTGGEAAGGGLDGLRLAKSASVLGVDIPNAPESVIALRNWLRSMRIVRAGVPRQGGRSATILKKVDGRWSPVAETPARTREEVVAVACANLAEETFEELNAIGQRLHLWSRFEKRVTEVSTTALCFLQIDNADIGMVSDGTQRILEILLAMLTPSTSLLILEEPETSLHPGLVVRLLNELDAYETRLLITTHSPQIVSHFSPRQLRLVERNAGKTTVRALPTEQAERLTDYLSDEGTLGEYVFQGGLDDA